MLRTSDHDTSIQRLGPNHLLRIHAHEIPQEHARWMRKRLVQTDGGKIDGQPPVELHPALGGLDELRDVGMAGIEARVGVDDADDGARESIVRVSQRLDEGLAEEQREMSVTVGGQALPQPPGGLYRPGQIVVCARAVCFLVLLRHRGDGWVILGVANIQTRMFYADNMSPKIR